jgi:hypothetical protein
VAAAGEWLTMSQSAELPSKQELPSKFQLQSERNTKLTPEGAANYSFAWQAGPAATVSIPARLNMSRASSQPATLRAEIIPASKDSLSIAETIDARLREIAAISPPHRFADIRFGVAVRQAAVERTVERSQDMALETLE